MGNSETINTLHTLPEGWIWTTIGEILILEYGKALPYKLRVQNGKYPVYGSNGKVGLHNDFLIEGPVIILGRKGSVGAVHFDSKKCWPIDTTYYITQTKSLNQIFIYYLFKCLRLEKLDSSTAIPGINRNSVYDLKVGLPPLEEQHRIVSKIEELFSELEHAEEGLKKAQKQLEVYRQALLKSAFEGKLTEKWREENSEYDAIDQLKRIKAERNFSTLALENKLSTNISFERSELINTWASAILENLIGIYARIGWKGLTKDEYTEKGPLFLSVHSLNYGKTIVFHQANHISNDRYDESPEIRLQINDILLCKDGAGIGKVGIVKHLPDKATVNSSLLVIRSFEAFSADFLYYLFLGPSMQKIVAEKISGSAIPHLFQKDIKQFSLQVPPIEEQQQIVQELESRFTLIEELELAIASGLSKTNIFRQSILKKAFEGRLQPQFSHEEVAMELLQRIQIEKGNYLLEQRTAEKQKPRKVKPMETNKSILEVLQETNDQISPKELWLKSRHKDNIEDFYSELKEISSLINESKNLVFTESLISLKNEN